MCDVMKKSLKTVLVLGSGGREHCIATTLAKSKHVSKVLVAPGNGGTGPKLSNVAIPVSDFVAINAFCHKECVDLVVVGPEQPLAEGIVGYLKQSGIQCFGPSKEAAMIETSKAWSKAFMERNDIPTAKFQSYTNFQDASTYLETRDYDVVLKASGLAAGKGVLLPTTKAEARGGLRDIMQDGVFGAAGDEIVIEERLEGPEVSILAFTDGFSFVCAPPSQDHKRAYDGDKGPNTGGMGAYCPSDVSAATLKVIEDTVIRPAIDGLRREGRPFVGVLYAGIMLTARGPMALEFNCRMGDPETQAVLPLLSTDFYEVVDACARGCLDSVRVEFTSQYSCAVVAASGGYPGKYEKGKEITGTGVKLLNTHVFHAGTKGTDSRLVTSGGRVLAVTGLGNTLKEAVDTAYAGMGGIKFDGMFYRKDIAYQALNLKTEGERQGELTYARAGVNIDVGDRASKLAYEAACSTFEARAGDIGAPVRSSGGFAGLLDMGDFYLVQGDDGVGTKSQVAEAMGKYDTLGYDLLAMVCDDAVCVGAETISITNTIDVPKIDAEIVAAMMDGLAKACREQKIVIPGGEIAELGPQIRQLTWNATAVGVVAKTRVMTGERVQVGDRVLALREGGFRANGFSLARHILAERFGVSDWRDVLQRPFDSAEVKGLTYGEALLRPSIVYSSAVLNLIGRYKDKDEKPKVDVTGIAHITGGGIPGNISRVLKNTGFGVKLDNLFAPCSLMAELQSKGEVSDREAYRTWNMGNGMLITVSPDKENVGKALKILQNSGIEAQIAGCVIQDRVIQLESKGSQKSGLLAFPY
eukprot:339073_1